MRSCIVQVGTVIHCAVYMQGVSNSLYALALLQCRADRLIASLTVAADGAAAQMDAQQLSNTLWALARLDVALPDTLLTLTRELADRQANSQDMGNAIWALAHLNCTSAEQLQVQYSQLQLASLNCTVSVGLSIQTRGLDARLHLHKICDSSLRMPTVSLESFQYSSTSHTSLGGTEGFMS